MKTITMLYSGGTDSTAAAALVAEHFERVVLVTYRHSGLYNIENSGLNIPSLQRAFPQVKFEHLFSDVDRLFKTVTFADYLKFIRRYGFFNLGTCGLCKLAMHLRTVVFCLENEITEVADGANVHSSHFPAQMAEVLNLVQKLYCHFGISYSNPVFDLDLPDNLDWYHKLGLSQFGAKRKEKDLLTPEGKPTPRARIACCSDKSFELNPPTGSATTGQVLTQRGILAEENVKGGELDRKMQARCFQLTLLNAFALDWFIPRHGFDRYREMTEKFYNEKISLFAREIEKWLEGKPSPRFSKAIEKMVDSPDNLP